MFCWDGVYGVWIPFFLLPAINNDIVTVAMSSDIFKPQNLFCRGGGMSPSPAAGAENFCSQPVRSCVATPAGPFLGKEGQPAPVFLPVSALPA